MVFSNTTDKNGLIQDCERIIFNEYGAISGNTTRLAEFTALLNQSLDDTAVDIMRADRNWKWDDRNHTDAPISTTDLVSGQSDYQLDISFLKIEKVEAMDEAGNWFVLADVKEVERDESFSERFETNGIPRYYDLRGDWLYVFPATNYNKTDGLKVYFQRGFSHFVTSDTVKTPGCPSPFHPIVSMRACYKYAFPKQMPIAQSLELEIRKSVANLKNNLRTRNPRGRNRVLPKFKASN
jgi:hypothetical protein